MPQPLSKAQRKFQAIKRRERNEARHRAFLAARRRIEVEIAEQLESQGFEVNERAVRNLAFEQAKRERAREAR